MNPQALRASAGALAGAQLGWPDMRLPILYTMSWPERVPCSEATWPRLDFTKCAQLTFTAPDREKYPAMDLAYAAGRCAALALRAESRALQSSTSQQCPCCRPSVSVAWQAAHMLPWRLGPFRRGPRLSRCRVHALGAGRANAGSRAQHVILLILCQPLLLPWHCCSARHQSAFSQVAGIQELG